MNDYIKWLLNSRSAPLSLPYFLPNKNATKEITESVGCFMAAKEIDYPLDKSIVIVAGDGIAPRTGAIFALYSKAVVHSIDPLLRPKAEHQFQLENIFGYAKKGEDVKVDCGGKRVLIVLPHSHCPMPEAVKIPFNYSRMDIVNLPCCVPVPGKFLTKENSARIYVDKNILSGKNMIYIWENYKK